MTTLFLVTIDLTIVGKVECVLVVKDAVDMLAVAIDTGAIILVGR